MSHGFADEAIQSNESRSSINTVIKIIHFKHFLPINNSLVNRFYCLLQASARLNDLNYFRTRQLLLRRCVVKMCKN